MVSYSEVYGQFRGTGADNKIALKIRQIFEDDADFERGYDRFSNFTGHDGIIGFNHCEEAGERLRKIHKAIP